MPEKSWIVFKFRFSGGVGYKDTQCIRQISETFFDSRNSIARVTSCKSAAPEEMNSGNPLLATLSSSSEFTISPEAIFKTGTFNWTSKSTLVAQSGVEKKTNPSLCAAFWNSR